MAGVVEILMGLLHFVMPKMVYESPGFHLLNGSQIDFISLSIYAVGILLVAFGSLTIVVSFNTGSCKVLLLPFLVIKSFLWSARISLELVFPVAISFFHLMRPTTLVMPLLIVETLLFVIPTAYYSKTYS